MQFRKTDTMLKIGARTCGSPASAPQRSTVCSAHAIVIPCAVTHLTKFILTPLDPAPLSAPTTVLAQIREWSKRVGLDGAITNLPKMSSLILRWSLDNTSPPQPSPPPQRAPPSPSVASDGGSGGGADAKDGGCSYGRARQRELRSSLQAFLEVRQVWRLLSGRGETDPAVLSIAGEFTVHHVLRGDEGSETVAVMLGVAFFFFGAPKVATCCRVVLFSGGAFRFAGGFGCSGLRFGGRR